MTKGNYATLPGILKRYAQANVGVIGTIEGDKIRVGVQTINRPSGFFTEGDEYAVVICDHFVTQMNKDLSTIPCDITCKGGVSCYNDVEVLLPMLPDGQYTLELPKVLMSSCDIIICYPEIREKKKSEYEILAEQILAHVPEAMRETDDKVRTALEVALRFMEKY